MQRNKQTKYVRSEKKDKKSKLFSRKLAFQPTRQLVVKVLKAEKGG